MHRWHFIFLLMPDPRASWRILSELKRRSSDFRLYPGFTTAKLPASYLLLPPPLQRKTYLAVSTCSTTTSEVPVFNGCVFMGNLTPSSAKTHRPSHLSKPARSCLYEAAQERDQIMSEILIESLWRHQVAVPCVLNFEVVLFGRL